MTRDRLVRLLFDIGVIGKGIDGVLEIIGGALLLVIPPVRLHGIVRALTQHELSEDPRDMVAHALLQVSSHLSADTQAFGAAYLLWHGVVKVGLVAGLLANRLWAYPIAIAGFSAFLAYQLYRWVLSHSVWMLLLSIVDVFVIVLTWLEYRRMRR